MRTLVVVNHPSPDGFARAALARVLAGLDRRGDDVRVIDLDAEDFDPRLTVEERRGHLDGPETKPQIADHAEALRWAERLVLVYPTWFGGFPARLKGWFDRVWVNGVAYDLPDGSTRVKAGLRNIRHLEVVTTHGSSRLLNVLQGNPGKLTVYRMLRLLCHPLCRRRFTAIYELDQADEGARAAWLDLVEKRYAN